MLNEVVTNLLIWMWSIQSTTISKTAKTACTHANMQTCTHRCTDTHRDTNTLITQTCFTFSFGHKVNCQQSGRIQNDMLDVNYLLHTHKKRGWNLLITSLPQHSNHLPKTYMKKVAMHITITKKKPHKLLLDLS